VAEPLFFEPTPGPGDSEGGDIYPPDAEEIRPAALAAVR
jgi:hypothetical protein